MTDVIAIVGTAATVAAVLVALFQDRLRRWLWSPRVAVDASVTPFSIRQPSDGKYVKHAFGRLRIAVHSKRGFASDVQVHLVKCGPPPRLGGSEPIPHDELLIPLRFSFDHSTAVNIAPGAARYVDLFEVRYGETDFAYLATVPAPPEGYRLAAEASQYRIDVMITGQNLKPVRERVAVLHTGGWDGSQDGLVGTLEATMDDA